MMIQRLEHADRPNEVAVWLTHDTLQEVDAAIAQNGHGSRLSNLAEEHRRAYCHRLLELTGGDPKRHLVDLDGIVRLDSNELGHDVVARFASPQPDADLFDPDYAPVDFTFHVLDGEGGRAMDDFLADPTFSNSERIERAMNAARLVVSFSFTPPNLA